MCDLTCTCLLKDLVIATLFVCCLIKSSYLKFPPTPLFFVNSSVISPNDVVRWSYDQRKNLL